MEGFRMSISIWSLKKMPMDQVTAYIQTNGSVSFQARMANLPVSDYEKLAGDEARERLIDAISKMSGEQYDDYLLELIDE
jgi:hypothetical protein